MTLGGDGGVREGCKVGAAGGRCGRRGDRVDEVLEARDDRK